MGPQGVQRTQAPPVRPARCLGGARLKARLGTEFSLTSQRVRETVSKFGASEPESKVHLGTEFLVMPQGVASSSARETQVFASVEGVSKERGAPPHPREREVVARYGPNSGLLGTA